ncbi:MAG: tetratricopeptide repeat protein, partial [Telmatospirillum sp.]|nr:tetratricopeptide repeat protein [Telmatospirillum sp.]
MTDPVSPEGAAAAERADGDRLRVSGRGLAALLRYDRALCLAPDDPVALHNRALAMAGLGRLDEAATGYRRALRLMPDNPVILSNLGLAEQRRGRLPEALACFRTVAAITPDSSTAWASLGDALARAGDADMACLCLHRALALDPAMVAAYVNLAAAARRSGDRDGAIAACRHALSLQSGLSAVLSNLGGLLVDLGRASEAVAGLRQAIAADPAAAPAYYNLALALRAVGCWDMPGVPGARDMCRRLIHLTPDHAGGRLLAVTGTLPIVAMTAEDSALAPARFAAALDDLEAWGRAHPVQLGAALGSSQPFHLAYRPGNHRAILSRLGDLAAGAAAARWRASPPAAALPDGRPIRIGVVSAHVRRHPVWDVVLKGLVAHLDRDRFRLFLYHTGGESDAETDWARRQCPDFRQGPRSVEQWIGVIGQDAPDILYYPEIGMDPTASALAVLRLARVQAAGWGHPITTGLPEMDLFLSGELLEDPDAGDHYRERLVRLPGTGVCTEPVPVRVHSWDGADAVMPGDGMAASGGGGFASFSR